MLQADELANILETSAIVSDRAPNAKRLFTALEESIARDNVDPQSLPNHTIEKLRSVKSENECLDSGGIGK